MTKLSQKMRGLLQIVSSAGATGYPSFITSTLTGLEQRGLVRWEREPNGRMYLWTLTEEGRAAA